MYNFKEKKIHFNALRNPDAAAFDLELLRKRLPSHPGLSTFARNPKRYADDILYALLDLSTREDIRGFRRAKLEGAPELPTEPTPDGTGMEEVEALRQSLEESEERADEAQEAQEEAEQRAEAAEAALEAEKKKELPPPVEKSKKTRSTRKSTGTTSSTRKSK